MQYVYARYSIDVWRERERESYVGGRVCAVSLAYWLYCKCKRLPTAGRCLDLDADCSMSPHSMKWFVDAIECCRSVGEIEIRCTDCRFAARMSC